MNGTTTSWKSLLGQHRRPSAGRRAAATGPSLAADLVVLLAVVLLPVFYGDSFTTQLTTKFLAFALLAVSLDILWGYGGLVSFGQSALFGVGAYASGYVLQHVDGLGGTYLSLLAAIGVTGGLGLVVGAFLFSGRTVVGGFAFSIVTLALGLVLALAANAWDAVTGGSNGLYGYANPVYGIPGLEFDTTNVLDAYWYVVIFGGLGYVAVRLLLRSDFGIVLRASADNEQRLEGVGHSVAVVRTVAFVVSAAVAGLAGALYIPTGIVTPQTMALEASTLVIIWVALGGRGTLIGPALGAVGLSWLQNYLSGSLLTLSNLVTGVALIVIVLAWPDGLLGAVRRLTGLVRR